MAKGNSAIVIDSDRIDFYKHFLNFMKPINPISKLQNKQIEILASLLYKRWEIEQKVNDYTLIPKLLFSIDSRNDIMKMCGITDTNYYGVISIFKKLKIIVDNDLSKKVIPESVNDKFSLIIAFTIHDKE